MPVSETFHVVDDDDSVRRSISRLLHSRGWNVITYESGSDFLERLPVNAEGCLLLDLQMPGMSGLEMQQRLAVIGVHLPIVFLTGHGDIPLSVRAIKHGAVDFLEKPVDEDALFSALGEAVARQRDETKVLESVSRIRACYARLSKREEEVLHQVINGRLNKQIACDLGIAEKTVKVHRARVMHKMEARSLAALVAMCLRANISLSP